MNITVLDIDTLHRKKNDIMVLSGNQQRMFTIHYSNVDHFKTFKLSFTKVCDSRTEKFR